MYHCAVAPFTGAWIEIPAMGAHFRPYIVAPFTGAWIEITVTCRPGTNMPVAPFTGAWIEIFFEYVYQPISVLSLPSRERGLKSRTRQPL